MTPKGPIRGTEFEHASQRIKRAGGVVTGLSGVTLLWAVTGLVMDQEKLLAVLLVCNVVVGACHWGRTVAIAAMVAPPDASLP